MKNNATITAREFLEEMFNLDWMTSDEVETIVTAMELYAKGKCREQRSICMKEYLKGMEENSIAMDILNAPEPILELKQIA